MTKANSCVLINNNRCWVGDNMERLSIRELRIKNNMTQLQLAKALEVTTNAVGYWETGKRCPSLQMALKIAKCFGVTVEEINFNL